MSKFTYLLGFTFVLAIFSCNDTNLYTPANPVTNQDFRLIAGESFFQALTTVPAEEKYTDTFILTNNTLKLVNTIKTDSKCEMEPTITNVVNNQKDIELTYKDLSPTGTVSLGSEKNTELRHYFNIEQMGKGTGNTINVKINFVFPNSNLGTNRTLSYKISY